MAKTFGGDRSGRGVPTFDWVRLLIRFGFGAAAGAFAGLVLSMFHMGLTASWLIIGIPALVGGVVAAKSDI